MIESVNSNAKLIVRFTTYDWINNVSLPTYLRLTRRGSERMNSICQTFFFFSPQRFQNECERLTSFFVQLNFENSSGSIS